MQRVKLFRRGRYVGLVKPTFHQLEVPETNPIWEELELPHLVA